MAKWSESDKLRALAIVEVSSMSEAAKQTGIPRGTIGKWAAASKGNEKGNEPRKETKRLSKKIKVITEQAMAEAKEEAKGIIVDAMTDWAMQIKQMGLVATRKSIEVMEQGPNENEPMAQWLRSLVGAMAQSTEKHQLLMGQPTQRQEVINNDGDGDATRDSLESIRASIDDLRKMRERQFPEIGNEPSEGERPIITH